MVWGLAKCRGYLSVADCLSCFDFAVNQLKLCDVNNGATAAYSDCELRYDNYNFYIEADYRVNYLVCSNTTSPQPVEFRKAAEKLLLDLQFVVPKISNLYAVSTRQVGDGSATVYAIAQCNLNVNQSVCSECLRSRLSFFYGCLPATSGQALYNECYMRYSRTPFFGQNQTTDISSLLSIGDSSKKRSIIGGVVGGISFVLLVLAYFLFGKCKKTGGDQQDTLDAPEMKGTINYKHLQLATNNFSEENIIGKGGFGEVFKAILDDNRVVAVKKLKATYTGLKTGFENEIFLISHICHRNLLGLLGWSTDGSHLLLVLEYMPNGSLDRFLWGEKRGTLNWKQRCDIILGIARGLAHIHKEFHVKIVHRDIKSSNILLDEDFQPKIADFGLARLQPEDQSRVITKCAGTLGYTAPEYVLYGHLSDKVDTFSFGIVILEIISGRKCTYRNFDGSSSTLEHAWKLYENKTHMKLVDETMDAHQYEDEHVMKMIEIGLLCSQSQVSKRPTMPEALSLLPLDPLLEERQLSRPNFTDHNTEIYLGST